MALNFTAEEVFIATSETRGIPHHPIDNTIIFKTPIKILGKSMWAVKFNDNDEQCAVIFLGIDVTTENKYFEKKQNGEIFDDTSNKIAQLFIIGDENGIKGIQIYIK